MHIHKISTRDVRFQLAARAGSDAVAGSDVEELMAEFGVRFRRMADHASPHRGYGLRRLF